MRVRYSFSSRRTRKIDNIRKQKQEYPKIVEKIISESDIILEVLDSRFITETQNKEIEKLISKKNKKIIFVLNKADLIDKEKIKKSQLKELIPYVFVSSLERNGSRKLRDLIKQEAGKIKNKDKKTIGIIGYPNTGKSSLINLLIGKSSAGVGSDAGYTKGMQKLKLTSEIILLDTPGVIPQKKYSNIQKDKIAQHVIVGGRSYSQVKDPEMVIAQIIETYPNLLEKHYKIKAKGDSEILIEELGKKLNLLKKGGIVDVDKTARKILRDWQRGEIRV